MVNRHKLVRISLMAVACALPACTSNGNNAAAPPCTSASAASTAVLVYPPNGSTVSAALLSRVYIATQGSSLANASPAWNLIVGQGNGMYQYGSPLAPASLPPGGKIPPYTSPFYASSTFPAVFAPGQTVTVQLNSATTCSPAQIGSFSTS